MTGWPAARRIAYTAADPLPAVSLPLHHATGHVLAAPLVALAPLPPYDASAMDGWAVRGPAPWQVVGRVLAGDPAARPLRDGEAVEVATGAWVPQGCEGVLAYEDGLGAPHPAGRHVRRTGEECALGEQVLPPGAMLTPAATGLAAALGHDCLPVVRRPRVAARVTGSELLQQGLPGAGRVRDAVGPLLPPALAGWGAELVSVQHVPDDRARLYVAVRDTDAEVLLTSGASSVGRADHLLVVLQELGAQVLIDGVDVKPGHPQLLARLPDGRLLVGLPGNPLAALSGLVTLVAPLLAALSGRPLPPLGRGISRVALPSLAVHRLVPVATADGAVTPTGHGGASMLRGAALADAFAVVEPGVDVPADGPVALVGLP